MVPQQLYFTRWIYNFEHKGENFTSYILEDRNDFYSMQTPNRFYLPLKVEIEVFKNKNSNTTGAPLYFRTWSLHDPQDLTGLRPTIFPGCYYGDIVYTPAGDDNKKELVLFQEVKTENKLIVDVFENYYPSNPKERKQTITEHEWYKKKRTRSAL